LRSPLFACQIALETALSLDKERLSAKGHKQLQSIRINIERLVRIINDLLLIEQYESDTINLNTALENLKEPSEGSILSMLALAEKKQIKLEDRVPNIYLELDRERIMQVLVNYLSNAIKFSPIGATVVVTASIVGECAEVAVTDTGPGLRAQDALMIFEKFFQAAHGKQLGGNGLGLTITKLIIEAHAGSIGVSSEPGNGSTFWFRLPVKCSRD
jgi:two-component system phosphate regulon sensor histidine kinase PhoR